MAVNFAVPRFLGHRTFLCTNTIPETGRVWKKKRKKGLFCAGTKLGAGGKAEFELVLQGQPEPFCNQHLVKESACKYTYAHPHKMKYNICRSACLYVPSCIFYFCICIAQKKEQCSFYVVMLKILIQILGDVYITSHHHRHVEEEWGGIFIH